MSETEIHITEVISVRESAEEEISDINENAVPALEAQENNQEKESEVTGFSDFKETQELEEDTKSVPPPIAEDEIVTSSMQYLKHQLLEEDAKHIDMEQFRLNEKDSRDPSYTNLVLPYRVVCRQRYRRAGAMQRAQFIKEIKQHELLQNKALDGVRIHREFCNAVISQAKAEEMVKLTEKQSQRLEWIMKNEIR